VALELSVRVRLGDVPQIEGQFGHNVPIGSLRMFRS
jgi:hypothetical protein